MRHSQQHRHKACPGRERIPVSPEHLNTAAAAPLVDADLARLEHLLSSVPGPLQPMDLSALDGYLCGVLLQPRQATLAQWWPAVLDVEGRPAPDAASHRELQQLVLRRHAELNAAISQRQWFDPWIFAGDDGDGDSAAEAETETDAETDDDADPAQATEAVLPWVAGFAAAMEHFPQLMNSDDPELVEPMALLFMHFNPDDLEDADALLAMIETLEPPADLAEAVQDIVRALMLMADVTRPRPAPPQRPPPRPTARRTGAARSRPTRKAR
jgi:uncharacterized protein